MEAINDIMAPPKPKHPGLIDIQAAFDCISCCAKLPPRQVVLFLEHDKLSRDGFRTSTDIAFFKRLIEL
jgi:hypothetical protein